MVRALKTLHLAIPLFFLSATTIQVDELYRAVFFCAVLPATLFLICRERKSFFTNTPSAFWVGAALLTYLFASTLWSTDITSKVAIRHLRWLIGTGIFICCMYIIGRDILENRRPFRHIAHAIVLFATVATLATYMLDGLYPARLTGPGFLSHAIQGPSALISLWAIGFIDRTPFDRRNALLTITATSMLLAYTLLTQSRGPLITLIVAIILYSALYLRSLYSLKLWPLIMLPMVTLGALITQIEWAFFQELLDRGSSFRLVIWKHTLSEASNHWLFGAGVATNLRETSAGLAVLNEVGINPEHPHSIIISMLYYGGVVGLGLFCIFSGLLLRGLICARLTGTGIACMISLITTFLLMSSDGYRLTSGPSPMWLTFWAPFALSLAYIAHHASKKQLAVNSPPYPQGLRSD
ncbi:O-antigen ligase family protein [uncultured Microbulbifer sp.]|uniref:O-antigen ligase family protein n=1 Tax=uncultured Microbulbifer sp. TaxID=348147 RepID=UPI002617390F|nr:O-antigen ligase family protein [uncultured Microbulbifer sp.]